MATGAVATTDAGVAGIANDLWTISTGAPSFAPTDSVVGITTASTASRDRFTLDTGNPVAGLGFAVYSSVNTSATLVVLNSSSSVLGTFNFNLVGGTLKYIGFLDDAIDARFVRLQVQTTGGTLRLNQVSVNSVVPVPEADPSTATAPLTIVLLGLLSLRRSILRA